MFAALKPSVLLVAIALIIHDATAFSPVNMKYNQCSTSSSALFAERREVLNTAVASLMGGFAVVGPAWATDEDGAVDDLAMPSQEEEKAKEEAAMAERLRRKAELQKKNAKPMNYSESMKAEKEKQKELQKSGAERRNALCEELGRGC